ncbi:unnamed protein product, partial [Ectocarpus fasciculatus]
DTQAPNFRDVRLTIHCIPGDGLNRGEADVLCQRLQLLFENQGAAVTVVTTEGLIDDGFGDALSEDGDDGAERDSDLVMELRARVARRDDSLAWTYASAVSGTLIPVTEEEVFTQEVILRDGTGFLLAQATFEGRLTRRIGVGPWASNALLNLLVRDDDEKLTEDTVKEDLSADIYSQLSQLAFNARMQQKVLKEAGAWK